VKGTLVLVSTPIGNLEDMSPRAARIMAEADLLLAEDTRRTVKLVPPGRKLTSYNDVNARGRLPLIIENLEAGRTVALVSDAGTPGISDPAYRAVQTAIQAGAGVTTVPGPSSVIAALVASGLPTDRFAFEGFLPRKAGPRLSRIRAMAGYTGTLVYFSGPHHAGKLLEELLGILGDRRCCLARELTKVHEEYVRGTLGSLAERYREQAPRGEVTLLVQGSQE
jgi:16S rRNA (cytidine1402-2'-O)-methyltransferase